MGKKAAADTPTMEEFVPHFQNLFANESSSTPDHERYLPTQHIVKEELGQPFTKNELLTALMRTKSKSAPGEDDIAAEFYKYGGEKVQDELLDICNGVLMSGQVPQIWKDAIIVPIFKKGDSRMTANYRGISLSSHAGKIFERMILNRLLDYVTGLDECIPDTQFGFLRGKGTTDALAISRRITELSRNAANENLFKCYIDLTKAYDKVDR